MEKISKSKSSKKIEIKKHIKYDNADNLEKAKSISSTFSKASCKNKNKNKNKNENKNDASQLQLTKWMNEYESFDDENVVGIPRAPLSIRSNISSTVSVATTYTYMSYYGNINSKKNGIKSYLKYLKIEKIKMTENLNRNKKKQKRYEDLVLSKLENILSVFKENSKFERKMRELLSKKNELVIKLNESLDILSKSENKHQIVQKDLKNLCSLEKRINRRNVFLLEDLRCSQTYRRFTTDWNFNLDVLLTDVRELITSNQNIISALNDVNENLIYNWSNTYVLSQVEKCYIKRINKLDQKHLVLLYMTGVKPITDISKDSLTLISYCNYHCVSLNEAIDFQNLKNSDTCKLQRRTKKPVHKNKDCDCYDPRASGDYFHNNCNNCCGSDANYARSKYYAANECSEKRIQDHSNIVIEIVNELASDPNVCEMDYGHLLDWLNIKKVNKTPIDKPMKSKEQTYDKLPTEEQKNYESSVDDFGCSGRVSGMLNDYNPTPFISKESHYNSERTPTNIKQFHELESSEENASSFTNEEYIDSSNSVSSQSEAVVSNREECYSPGHFTGFPCRCYCKFENEGNEMNTKLNEDPLIDCPVPSSARSGAHPNSEIDFLQKALLKSQEQIAILEDRVKLLQLSKEKDFEDFEKCGVELPAVLVKETKKMKDEKNWKK